MLHAHQAYASSAKAGLSGRRLLAAVLSRCALDLQRALDLHRADGDTADLVGALERNRRAWSLIAEELADPESTIGPDVRNSLGRLATFAFREIAKAAQQLSGGREPSGPQTHPADRRDAEERVALAERLEPLIEVNRNVAAGFETGAP